MQLAQVSASRQQARRHSIKHVKRTPPHAYTAAHCSAVEPSALAGAAARSSISKALTHCAQLQNAATPTN
eukprot:15965-Heterococcus_DN1.PRE.4